MSAALSKHVPANSQAIISSIETCCHKNWVPFELRLSSCLANWATSSISFSSNFKKRHTTQRSTTCPMLWPPCYWKTFSRSTKTRTRLPILMPKSSITISRSAVSSPSSTEWRHCHTFPSWSNFWTSAKLASLTTPNKLTFTTSDWASPCRTWPNSKLKSGTQKTQCCICRNLRNFSEASKKTKLKSPLCCWENHWFATMSCSDRHSKPKRRNCSKPVSQKSL